MANKKPESLEEKFRDEYAADPAGTTFKELVAVNMKLEARLNQLSEIVFASNPVIHTLHNIDQRLAMLEARPREVKK